MTVVRPTEVVFATIAGDPGWRALDEIRKVTRVERIASDYTLVEFECSPQLAACRPGQFLMIRPLGERYLVRRPFTVFDAECSQGLASIVFRVTGVGTAAISRLRPGDPVSVLGPLGNGFEIRPETRRALVLARGAGMASLYQLSLRATANGIRTTILLSARRADLRLAESELRAAGADVIGVDDESGSSDPARVAELIEPWFEEEGGQVFVCGSARLLRLATALANRQRCSVQAALEAPMACGIGTCHACPVGTPAATEGALVCVDGPVFAARLREPEARPA